MNNIELLAIPVKDEIRILQETIERYRQKVKELEAGDNWEVKSLAETVERLRETNTKQNKKIQKMKEAVKKMRDDVVIMSGEMLDALSNASENWRKKYEGKVAENIEISKKLVDLTRENKNLKEWQEEADKLIGKLIKENNELHRQIDEQATVEQSLWNTIWGLEHQIRFYDEDMEEFN